MEAVSAALRKLHRYFGRLYFFPILKTGPMSTADQQDEHFRLSLASAPGQRLCCLPRPAAGARPFRIWRDSARAPELPTR